MTNAVYKIMGMRTAEHNINFANNNLILIIYIVMSKTMYKIHDQRCHTYGLYRKKIR